MEPILHTARLKIRICSDAEMQAFVDAEPNAELKLAYQEMLDGSLSHPAERGWYAIRSIEERDSGQLVGDLCFKGLQADGTVELGYGIRDDCQNRGYATEAVRAVSEWAMRQPGVRRVEAETEPWNLASQRVLEKAGYLPTGVLGAEGPRFVYCGSSATDA